jgi:hypothetical protein
MAELLVAVCVGFSMMCKRVVFFPMLLRRFGVKARLLSA